MTRRRGQPEIDEGPDEADLERFGGVTRACPNCKAELYDDAEVCWRCGHAFGGAGSTLPTWVLIAAAALIVVFLAAWLVR